MGLDINQIFNEIEKREEKYIKFNEFSTVLCFYNNRKIKVDVKYNLIDNQVIRCLKLDTILSKRKMIIKD